MTCEHICMCVLVVLVCVVTFALQYSSAGVEPTAVSGRAVKLSLQVVSWKIHHIQDSFFQLVTVITWHKPTHTHTHTHTHTRVSETEIETDQRSKKHTNASYVASGELNRGSASCSTVLLSMVHQMCCFSSYRWGRFTRQDSFAVSPAMQRRPLKHTAENTAKTAEDDDAHPESPCRSDRSRDSGWWELYCRHQELQEKDVWKP